MQSLLKVVIEPGAKWGSPEVHGKAGRSNAEAIAENYLVGAVGVEPTTNGLKGRCSTTELRSYKHSSNILHENRLSDTRCAGNILDTSGNPVK